MVNDLTAGALADEPRHRRVGKRQGSIVHDELYRLLAAINEVRCCILQIETLDFRVFGEFALDLSKPRFDLLPQLIDL